MKNLWKLVHPLASAAASSLCREDPLAFCCQIQLLSLGLCLCLAWKAKDRYGASGHEVSELKPKGKKKNHGCQKKKKKVWSVCIDWITVLDFVTSLLVGNLSNDNPFRNLAFNQIHSLLKILRNSAFKCREFAFQIFTQINKKSHLTFTFTQLILGLRLWFSPPAPRKLVSLICFYWKSAFIKDI